MKTCATCHRLIWPLPWGHVGFYTVAPGDIVYWHSSCGTPRWVQGQLARQRSEPVEIIGWVNPDGSGVGNWAAYEGMSPLEQYHADGAR